MIKNNKIKIIISSVLILLPAILGAIFWDSLPEKIITHFGISGIPTTNTTSFVSVFFLPAVMLVLHWVMILFSEYECRKKGQNPRVLANVLLWIFPTLTITLSTIIYTSSIGVDVDPYTYLVIFFGLLFSVIGNYLPKIRQSKTIGIKISWTLESEANWNATHRMAGKLWVVCGFILMLTSLLPIRLSYVICGIVLGVAIIVPIIYSYVFHKKELKEGTLVKTNKKTSVITIIVVSVVIIFVALILFTGNISYTLEEDSVTLDYTYWTSMTVNFEDIESAELLENFGFGSRAYGFGTPRIGIGTFRNAQFGSYTLYAYLKNDTAILLSTKSGKIVINSATKEETEKLFEKITKGIE